MHNGSKFFAVGTASSLVSSHHSLDISSAFWFYKTFIYFVGLKASWVQEEVKFIPSEALRLELKHSLKLDLELQMKMSQRKLCMKGSYEGSGVSSYRVY
ncbi:hypothetical protein P8452_20491 [Trifolium repens]|nr:hypothetical protein P8452_20491 [Trifolium repens]